jgi:hypothetical protein
MRVLALAPMVCVLLSACGGGAGGGVWGVAPAGGERGSAAAAGGGVVRVTVSPAATGAIEITAGPVSPAPRNDARPWMRHQVVFRNTGGRSVTFAHPRRSAFLGDPRAPALLAADEGCGYEKHAASVSPGACLTYLDAFTIEPGASVARTVTLFKGLAGMRAPAPGVYVFEKRLRFQTGSSPPGESTGRSVTITLTYEIGGGCDRFPTGRCRCILASCSTNDSAATQSRSRHLG